MNIAPKTMYETIIKRLKLRLKTLKPIKGFEAKYERQKIKRIIHDIELILT